MARKSGVTTAIVIVFSCLGALWSCGSSAPRAGSPPPSAADDSTLGAGDVFDVRVFGEESLSSSYRVAQDGSIDFPLVGRLAVAGLEPTQIADLIQRELQARDYLRNPQVSVFVKEYNSKRVSVMGAVARPGTFPVSSQMTVVQVISLAGGFTPLANRDGTVLTRRTSGQIRRYPIAAGEVAEGNAEDLPVRAGDIIYVPERLF